MSESADLPVYRAHTFEDLLNTVPTMFGFVPRESVIGVCVSGPRNRFGFRLRVDIPEDREHDAAVAELVAGHLRRNVEDAVILIALSEDPAVAEDLLHAIRDLLDEVPVRLMLWATSDRLWTDLPDCPAAGEPYTLSEVHAARVAAVAAGHRVLEDRDALYAELAPASGPRMVWVHDAVETVLDAVCRASDGQAEAAQVRRLLDRDDGLTDGELVRLGVLVTDITTRDVAWLLIDRENAPRMHALWCAVARLMPVSMSVPALCLAGFSAWLWGDGARALVALERARDIAPGYSMGSLLTALVSNGVSPEQWDEVQASDEQVPRAVATRQSA